MDRIERAEKYFRDGYACSQSVFTPWAVDAGMDEETALRISSSFGGGIGRMAGMCGAVTGAFMVLGLRFGRAEADDHESRDRNYDKVREFARIFREENGDLACSNLLGADISTPEGYDAVAGNEEYFRKCLGFVRSAAAILEDLAGD
ncbi:MAG TPA: C-GCAxxG-C-C family protein [Candidatus Krumholzibacterium sp.]|nr:C-GCAxxG-C-C family protein [Candidatus Krumholzibacterium sp.]